MSLFAQRSKNGSYTATSANTVVNTYTYLSANATAGAGSISVNNASMTGAQFSGALAAGDLILIIQMQGADIDCDVTTTASWGGNYTTPYGHQGDWYNFIDLWGRVLDYHSAGKFERVEVQSVSGNTINLQCALANSYSAAGHTQIVRIPRYNNLTVNAGASIVPLSWNGNTGGIVALEVEGTLTLNNSATVPNIHANGFGFRPGYVDGTGQAGGSIGIRYPGSQQANEGSEKGEGIGGYTNEYVALYSRYGISAAANGGGGGGYQNCGGGGGSNVGSVTGYTGKGVPQPGYTAIWNLEQAGMGTSSSPGGGRGGYAFSENDLNESTTGPNNLSWGGDGRQTNGGRGGHPLAYDVTRIFMGGGGGAGDQDSGQGGSGGSGGGIVFITVYGNVSGTGRVEANGAAGQKTNPNNQSASFGQKKGNDGAGGGGGGGSVFFENMSGIPNTYTLAANGGAGGNHALSVGPFASAEASGPGGGGSGGLIALTTGTPVQTVAGGSGGTSNSAHVSAFPPNGATNGASGLSGQTTTLYNLIGTNDTICGNSAGNLSVQLTGTMPSGGTIAWYTSQFGNTVVNTGTTYTTPVLSATTTYYVGICPGTFRIPVKVVVGTAPVITGTAVVTDATCNTPGSVTGLSASGSGTLSYSWNGTSTPTIDLTNASPNTYTLTVTDASGCTATSGPYTINGVGGPVVDASNVAVQDESCNGTQGAITGITASGTGLSYAWTNTTQTTLNINGLSAGNYTLTVTDNNGCTATSGPYTVNLTPGPSVNSSAATLTDETCGQGNGAISGITANGTGLSYAWTNTTQTTLNISGLSAGNYTLTVTDANGCTASGGPFTINNTAGPTVNTSGLSITDEACGTGNGAISGIQVSGGTPGYTFAWTNTTQTTLDITGLSAGNYTLTVTDAGGCTSTSGPHTVTALAGPSINDLNSVVTDESCAGGDGSVSGITASGNGLSYSWTNTTQTTPAITGLSAGNYTLTVTDNNGCTASSGPYTVSGAVPLLLDQSNMTVTPTACNANTGSISGITLSGGVNPVFSWSNTSQSTLDISGLAAGTYTLTVTDDQNCSQTISVFINITNPPVIDLNAMTVTDEHCGQADGTVNGISVNGGTPAYTYSWNNDPALTTSSLTGLTAGAYQLVVTDTQGCTDTADLTVNNTPRPIIDHNNINLISATCGDTNGAVIGLAVNGSGPFTYVWDSDTVPSIDLKDVPPGMHTLIVIDAFGCESIATSYKINSIAAPQANFTINPEEPQAGETVYFTDASSGPVISWVWDLDTTTSFSQNPSGTYEVGDYYITLHITDTNGCTDSITKLLSVLNEVEVPNVLTLNGDNLNDIFTIKGLKKNSALVILNRWGDVVFKTDNYQNDWNGRDTGGELLTAGVYQYLLTMPDGTVKQGFVHLLF